MLHQLKTFLNFNAFCCGCERYAEMLVAMGLAPQTSIDGEQIPTDTPQPGVALLDQTAIAILKTMQYLPHVAAATPSPRDIFHHNS
jgi:hypothetical protein